MHYALNNCLSATPLPLAKTRPHQKKTSGWCRPAAELRDQSVWPLSHIQYISIHKMYSNLQQRFNSNCKPVPQACWSLHLSMCPSDVHSTISHLQTGKSQKTGVFSHGNQPSIVFINLTHGCKLRRATVIPSLQQFL